MKSIIRVANVAKQYRLGAVQNSYATLRDALAEAVRSPLKRFKSNQTENGTIGGSTVFESTNAGFNGTGYVNASTNGGFAQINNVDGRGGGAKTLRIRFALGVATARTGRLVVNGVGTNITFNSTGTWTAWALQNVSVTLTNSTTNTIRFESTGQDLANIDQVEIL